MHQHEAHRRVLTMSTTERRPCVVDKNTTRTKLQRTRCPPSRSHQCTNLKGRCSLMSTTPSADHAWQTKNTDQDKNCSGQECPPSRSHQCTNLKRTGGCSLMSTTPSADHAWQTKIRTRTKLQRTRASAPPLPFTPMHQPEGHGRVLTHEHHTERRPCVADKNTDQDKTAADKSVRPPVHTNVPT